MRKVTRKEKYSGKKKTSIQKHHADKRTGKIEDSTGGYHKKKPRWLFQRCDFEHSKWGMTSNADKLTDYFKYLSALEHQSWGEILTVTSGRRNNTRNHHVPLTDIIKDAQKRAEERNLDEFDELCSIAVCGRMRIWGYIVDGLFYIIWFDSNHEICPSEKRNT